MRCPHCGATAIDVAWIINGEDPHVTYMCRAWKRCGRYFRGTLGVSRAERGLGE